MTNFLEVQKTAAILNRLADEYAAIEKIENQLENIKTEHLITRNLDAYCVFTKNEDFEQLARCAVLANMTLGFGMEFESVPLEDFCKFLFGSVQSLNIQNLRVAIQIIDLLRDKKERLADIVSLEAEVATIKYFEDLAYETVAPIVRKEIGFEASSYDF